MALLRPGRCCSRRQGGCLQHRTEAQRRPKGQDAGGTPALPGSAVPAVPWGVSGGRLLRMPTCTLLGNSRMPASRAPAPGPSGSSESETGFVSGKSSPRPPRRADHSRVKQVLFQARSKPRAQPKLILGYRSDEPGPFLVTVRLRPLALALGFGRLLPPVARHEIDASHPGRRQKCDGRWSGDDHHSQQQVPQGIEVVSRV